MAKRTAQRREVVDFTAANERSQKAFEVSHATTIERPDVLILLGLAVVTVVLRVTLSDRNGKVLWQNQNYNFREQYQISREISSFFEESSPALERMARDFGRTLVSNVLEAY